MSSLKDSLQLSLERVPSWLLSGEAREELLLLGARLPAVHHAGFEYQLGNAGGGLDLQQGIELNEANIRQVLAKTSGRNGRLLTALDEALRNQQAFESFFSAFTQIWLEFDLTQGNGVVPSIFLTLSNEATSDGLRAALDVLEALLGHSGHEQPLTELFSALLANGKTIQDTSHIGIMLSREVKAGRLVQRLGHLEQLQQPALVGPLAEQGQRLINALQSTARLFHEFRWCYDTGKRAPLRMELECFFPAREAAGETTEILDWLLDAGLCRPEEAQLLRDWPGMFTPADHAMAWPESLLIESLVSRTNELSALDYRLGHLKLTAEEGKPVRAKAYFGYVRRWLSAPDAL